MNAPRVVVGCALALAFSACAGREEAAPPSPTGITCVEGAPTMTVTRRVEVTWVCDERSKEYVGTVVAPTAGDRQEICVPGKEPSEVAWVLEPSTAGERLEVVAKTGQSGWFAPRDVAASFVSSGPPRKVGGKSPTDGTTWSYDIRVGKEGDADCGEGSAALDPEIIWKSF